MRRMGPPPPSILGAVTAWVVAAARRITTSSSAANASVRTRLFRKYVALFVTKKKLAPPSYDEGFDEIHVVAQ